MLPSELKSSVFYLGPLKFRSAGFYVGLLTGLVIGSPGGIVIGALWMMKRLLAHLPPCH